MHEKAKQWDEERRQKELPENRPCDWCGELVDIGYIHEDCMEQEREKWSRIME